MPKPSSKRTKGRAAVLGTLANRTKYLYMCFVPIHLLFNQKKFSESSVLWRGMITCWSDHATVCVIRLSHANFTSYCDFDVTMSQNPLCYSAYCVASSKFWIGSNLSFSSCGASWRYLLSLLFEKLVYFFVRVISVSSISSFKVLIRPRDNFGVDVIRGFWTSQSAV